MDLKGLSKENCFVPWLSFANMFKFLLTTATEKIKMNLSVSGLINLAKRDRTLAILSGNDIALKNLSMSPEALGSTVVPIVQIEILGKLLKFQV